jgi:HK97 family phage prohead protease
MRERFDVACELKLADTGADVKDGTIEGYASVFNLLDRGGDIVMPGAFKKSLAEWRKLKQMPSMLFAHDMKQPIGVWTEIAEDDKGLRVKGELVLEVQKGAEVHALLKRKALSGLSIGYRTLEDEYDRQTGARRLKRVELWEISLLAIPMLAEAQIDGVKTEFDAPQWERAFRDGGLSNREAKLATSIARKALREGERPEPPRRDGARDVLMEVRRVGQILRG